MARTSEVAQLARALMNEHGLGQVPFEFDRAKTRFGQCQFKRNNLTKVVFVSRIKMSEPLVRLNTIERCRETILHEIAHALAGHTAGHGPVWVATARKIGLTNPTRCCGEDVVRTPPAFEGFCEHCGEEPISFRHKTPPSNRICSKHRTPIMWRRRGSKKILLTSR